MEIPIQSTDSVLQIISLRLFYPKIEDGQMIDLIKSMIFAGQFTMNNYKY